MSTSLREAFVNALISRAGCPYRWGAQDGSHFDCSGLIVWGMAEIGRPIPDTNAAGLYALWHANKCMPDLAPIGSLYFYVSKKGGNISHVMAVVRVWDNKGRILIGARAGGASTVNDEKAYESGAMVDVVTAEYWKNNLVFAIDPFLSIT